MGKAMFRHTLQSVLRDFERKGYDLLEDKYINTTTKMKFACRIHKNEIQTTTYHNFKRYRHNCMYCRKEPKVKKPNKSRTPISEVILGFNMVGYKVINPQLYKNHLTKLECICKKHPEKIQKLTYLSIKRGHLGCSECIIDEKKSRKHRNIKSNWKGGVSGLQDYMRTFLKDWKLECLKQYDFKCFVTGIEDHKLHVHHVEPLHKIRDEVLKDYNLPIYQTIGEYPKELLDFIISKVVEKHENVKGIPLQRNIHKLFHHIYGVTDIKEEDVHEFKVRYLSGEFKDLVEVK